MCDFVLCIHSHIKKNKINESVRYGVSFGGEKKDFEKIRLIYLKAFEIDSDRKNIHAKTVIEKVKVICMNSLRVGIIFPFAAVSKLVLFFFISNNGRM